MIMDSLDALTPFGLGADMGVPSFSFDIPQGHSRHISEALDDQGLNTPVTKYSETTFFGPDSLEPPPIISTGRFVYSQLVFFYFIIRFRSRIDFSSQPSAVHAVTSKAVPKMGYGV